MKPCDESGGVDSFRHFLFECKNTGATLKLYCGLVLSAARSGVQVGATWKAANNRRDFATRRFVLASSYLTSSGGSSPTSTTSTTSPSFRSFFCDRDCDRLFAAASIIEQLPPQQPRDSKHRTNKRI